MTRRREIMVGVVIVAGVVAAVLGTLWLQDASFGRGTREVEALFTQVGQLMNGNAVKLRGVNIGRVEDISVEENGEAVRVRMRIRDDVVLPPISAVLLAPENMFGDWQAEIVNPSVAPNTQFEFLAPDEAEVLGGYALPEFSRLTSAADRISEDMAALTERVEEAFTEETARNLSRAIDNVQEVSERLRELVEAQAGAVSDLASEFEESARELGIAAHAAHLTFEKAEELLGAPGTDSVLNDARATVANLKELSGELSAATQGAQGMIVRIDSTFSRLDRMTAQIEAGEGALGLLMKDTLLVTQAQGVLGSLTSFLEDLQERPQRYVRLSIF
ncbi:MAG: MCE family protein [Gemmatimonadetes bacterium]|nr:MCE family protein [Gemmatimonadota bacterium]NNM07266.1 MCE family protein [Gemmatimonadota bacterium]